MKRKEFISTLGVGFAAVCTGCLAACGKGGSDGPSGGGGNPPPPPPTGVSFTADLNNEIKNVGDFKVSGGVILVRIAASNVVGSFTAVQQACTHEGTSIGFNANQNMFICPNHGSQFSTTGAVIQGPSTGGNIAALKKYNIAITGTTLTVTG